MSPRDSFWFLAGVLVAVAFMVTVRAWLRERPALGEASGGGGTRRAPIPSFAVPVAAALALVGVALGIYFLLGSPDSIASARASKGPSHSTPMGQQPSPAAGSLDDVTNKLASRLASQGGSDNDWQLLAESYEYMGRAAEAKAARAHVASSAPIAAASGDSTAAHASGDQIADIADAFDQPHVMTVANAVTGKIDNTEISGTVEISSKLSARPRQAPRSSFMRNSPTLPALRWPSCGYAPSTGR